MMRSEKLQRSTWPTSMRITSPSASRAVLRTGVSPTRIARAGLEHFQLADLLLVVARNLQQHVAAGAGGKQDVVGVEQARVVGNEVLVLAGEELEPSAQGARAAAQLDERQLAVVVEDDLVLQRRPRPACRS